MRIGSQNRKMNLGAKARRMEAPWTFRWEWSLTAPGCLASRCCPRLLPMRGSPTSRSLRLPTSAPFSNAGCTLPTRPMRPPSSRPIPRRSSCAAAPAPLSLRPCARSRAASCSSRARPAWKTCTCSCATTSPCWDAGSTTCATPCSKTRATRTSSTSANRCSATSSRCPIPPSASSPTRRTRRWTIR